MPATDVEGAKGHCLEWLSGCASVVSGPDQLVAEKISGGITNVLYKVQLKDAATRERLLSLVEEMLKSSAPSCPFKRLADCRSFCANGVGVRIFGIASECEVVDRHEEYAVTQAAAELCKTTHFRFPGGQIDEWLTGRHIKYAECRERPKYKAIAQHLARFHQVPYTQLPNEQHSLVSRLTYWVNFLVQYDQAKYGHLQRDLEVFNEVYESLKSFSVAREVLCHNDLLNGNIVITCRSDRGTAIEGEEESAIEFIDYEYASRGWNMYDIANYIVETADESWEYAFLHEEAYIRDFVREYFKSVRCLHSKGSQREVFTPGSGKSDAATTAGADDDAGETSSTDDSSSSSAPDSELAEALECIHRCAPLTHLYWAVWGLAQYANSPADVTCDFLRFSNVRGACAQLLKQGGLATSNRIIDLCKNVDEHHPIYWQGIAADFTIRRLFRQLLAGVGLREIEKRLLASGKQVGLAFVKDEDDPRPCVLGEIRAALVAAAEEVITEQLAALPAPGQPSPAEDEAIAAVPAATITHKLAGGLVSASEYREGKHLVVVQQPPARAPAPVPAAAPAFEPAQDLRKVHADNRQAATRFDAVRRAQEDLWGLSRHKQQRLMSHLERRLREDRSSSEEDVREAARFGRY